MVECHTYAGSGNSDFGTSLVKMFALQRQRAVIFTVSCSAAIVSC